MKNISKAPSDLQRENLSPAESAVSVAEDAGDLLDRVEKCEDAVKRLEEKVEELNHRVCSGEARRGSTLHGHVDDLRM